MIKYTDEQIKKIAECHIKRRCYDCPIGREDIQRLSKPCSTMISEILLDLINRQEADLNNIGIALEVTRDNLGDRLVELQQAEVKIDELEAEIERLKKENEYILMQHKFQRRPDGNCWNDVIEKAKSEAIKEYKSRVENDVVTLLEKSNCAEFLEVLGYRYKEMVGEGECRQ